MSKHASLEGCRAVRDERRAALANAVREGELELRRKELLDVRPANIVGLLDLDDAEDLHDTMRVAQDCNREHTHVDRPETGTVPCSHILVEGLDGIGTGELTELLVHVVRAGARVVAEPDTKVLDLERLLFVDLRGQPCAAPVSSHSACHLNGCKGLY